jgi:hypothetical protein
MIRNIGITSPPRTGKKGNGPGATKVPTIVNWIANTIA